MNFQHWYKEDNWDAVKWFSFRELSRHLKVSHKVFGHKGIHLVARLQGGQLDRLTHAEQVRNYSKFKQIQYVVLSCSDEANFEMVSSTGGN